MNSKIIANMEQDARTLRAMLDANADSADTRHNTLSGLEIIALDSAIRLLTLTAHST